MDNATENGTDADTHGQPPAPAGPRVSRDEMKDLGRLRRSVTHRHVAGVAGGLARHLDIDPIIVRVTLVVATFFGGAGLVAYVGAWILVPEEGTDDRPLGLDHRNRSIGLAGVGILALLCAVGDWAGAFWFPWQLAIVAVIVVWFLRRKDRRTPSGYGHDSGYGYDQPTFGGDTAASTTTSAPSSYAAPAYATPSYAAPAYAAPAYGAPSSDGPPTYEVRRQPRNPRRRGPILFFFTLALIALAEGVLGVVDVAGLGVTTNSAYPALALGITALMLLVGAFWGRAGGLIALGLVAALATAGTAVSDNFDAGDRTYAPTSSVDLRDSYEFGGGRFG